MFPEAFSSGYPKGADFEACVGMRSPEGRKWFRAYFESAITIPGPEVCFSRPSSEIFQSAGTRLPKKGPGEISAVKRDRRVRTGFERRTLPDLRSTMTDFARILTAALLAWKLHRPFNSHSRRDENLCRPTLRSRGFGSWRRLWRHR